MKSNCRDFIKKAATAGTVFLAAHSVLGSGGNGKRQKAVNAAVPFMLKYAPYFG
ncbi:MAG: hypothetical protein ABSG89_10885 [Bacteroidales bacterium]|jgi:hypothetical protein